MKNINWDTVLQLARSDPTIDSTQLEERALRYFVRVRNFYNQLSLTQLP